MGLGMRTRDRTRAGRSLALEVVLPSQHTPPPPVAQRPHRSWDSSLWQQSPPRRAGCWKRLGALPGPTVPWDGPVQHCQFQWAVLSRVNQVL